MDCVCHGLPAYWQKDVRLTAGGWWECPIKRQAHNATRSTDLERRARVTQQRRDRYDNDPVFRLEKQMRDNAVRRRKTIEARRARHGSLQIQG